MWIYDHEDLLPRELSQQEVLLISKILTLDQMIQIDKESDRQKSNMDKNKASMEWNIPPRAEDCEEGSSSSSMSMYNHYSNGEDSDCPSNRSPTIVLHDAPLPMHMEEVHSSPIMEKVSSERHFVIHDEDHPSSYNIEEIFAASTFNLCRKEFNRKRVRNVK